ncbi:hypothetical protein QYM36_018347 [Artemia franciscana]|uniref:Uncharacterized protein n=1 Tax=Artemia franciscana TaxID=6661 RepID=A0AA88HCM0_ARTSF|nr:hypothetical protein QYM36_018347 [Artemia franciscana]
MSQLSKTKQVRQEMCRYHLDILAPSKAVVNNIPKHDIMCVLGDLNDIVGNNEFYCPQALSRHGMCMHNKNGTMLIDFAMVNNLVIGGSLFPHRDVHKWSCTSPGGAVRIQIGQPEVPLQYTKCESI